MEGKEGLEAMTEMICGKGEELLREGQDAELL